MTATTDGSNTLYRVFSMVRKHRGCRNVKFDWFRTEPREAGFPYARLIGFPYGQFIDRERDAYAEGAIDELFTLDEATALKCYVDEHHSDEGNTTIEAAELPIPNNSMPLGAVAVGGNDDFYMLDAEDEYSLPFKVWGYFNLNGLQLVDEPGEVFIAPLHIVRAEGNQLTTHRETQREARARALLGGSRLQ